MGLIRNPWRKACPTFTGLSRVVARLHDPEGQIYIHRVHPLEQMGMMGWDLQMYAGGASPFDKATRYSNVE